MLSTISQIYTYKRARDILTKIINCSTYYQRKTLFYSFSVTIKDNLTFENQYFIHVLKSCIFKKLYFNFSVQPTATLNVSSPTTVLEYSDVYYSCEGKNGLPTSTVSWYKGNTLVVNGKILSLRNIKREEAGKYTCKVQSGTLTDETVLEIIVQCKFLYISTREHLF